MTITTQSNITLVTLERFPANLTSISKIFDEMGKYKLNIDMISMAPTHADYTSLSFTISDDDLVDILSFTSSLEKNMQIKVIVSSVNSKISIYDEKMRNTPGIAAQVFSAINATKADIRLITTSEVEIALLVSESDFDSVYSALCANL